MQLIDLLTLMIITILTLLPIKALLCGGLKTARYVLLCSGGGGMECSC
jgi:hypothetical protein